MYEHVKHKIIVKWENMCINGLCQYKKINNWIINLCLASVVLLVGGSRLVLLLDEGQYMSDITGQTMAVKVVVAVGLGELLTLVEVFVTDGTGAVGDVSLSQLLFGQLFK